MVCRGAAGPSLPRRCSCHPVQPLLGSPINFSFLKLFGPCLLSQLIWGSVKNASHLSIQFRKSSSIPVLTQNHPYLWVPICPGGARSACGFLMYPSSPVWSFYTAGQRLREVTGFASKDTAKEEQMQVQRRGSHLCHTVLLLEQWVSSRWDGAVRLSPLLDTHTET